MRSLFVKELFVGMKVNVGRGPLDTTNRILQQVSKTFYCCIKSKFYADDQKFLFRNRAGGWISAEIFDFWGSDDQKFLFRKCPENFLPEKFHAEEFSENFSFHGNPPIQSKLLGLDQRISMEILGSNPSCQA